MNFIVLSLVHIFHNMEGKKRYRWRLMAAFTGAAVSAVILVRFSYIPYVVVTVFGLVPLMIRMAFGRLHFLQMLRCILLSWLALVIVAGLAEAIHQWLKTERLTIYGGFFVLLGARGAVRMLTSSVIRQKNRMRVELCNKGRCVSCVGLYDSGNRLTMPQTGAAVHIIRSDILTKLDAEASPQRTIPFHALGTERGEIPVVQLEQMRISCGSRSACYSGVWLGCAGKELLRNSDYQIILNSAVRLI